MRDRWPVWFPTAESVCLKEKRPTANAAFEESNLICSPSVQAWPLVYIMHRRQQKHSPSPWFGFDTCNCSFVGHVACNLRSCLFLHCCVWWLAVHVLRFFSTAACQEGTVLLLRISNCTLWQACPTDLCAKSRISVLGGKHCIVLDIVGLMTRSGCLL